MTPWFSPGTTLSGLRLAGLQVGELPLGTEVSGGFPLCLNPDPSVLLWHGSRPSPWAASLGLWAFGGPWVTARPKATGGLEVPSLPGEGRSLEHVTLVGSLPCTGHERTCSPTVQN